MSIQIREVCKSFHGMQILKNISYDFVPSKLTTIVGRSGCGKSTLLRCLNGLEVLDSGVIELDNNQLTATKRFNENAYQIRQKVGMVFQSFNLFPHKTVMDNVMMSPMVVQKKSVDDARVLATLNLEKVGMIDHAHKYPFQLSGGQQQRVAIARALALKPKVLLYDEPTSALDPELVDEVFNIMKQLDAENMTQIVVTHEIRFARDASDIILYMEGGEIVESGSSEQIFSTNANPKTQQYLKKFI